MHVNGSMLQLTLPLQPKVQYHPYCKDGTIANTILTMNQHCGGGVGDNDKENSLLNCY